MPGARWVDAGNFHVTLRFIGEVDEGMASDIDDALAQIRGAALRAVARRGRSFRDAHAVGRASSATMHSPISTTRSRARSCASAFEPEGRRYAPHVTLARLEGRRRAAASRPSSPSTPCSAPRPFAVESFSLIASYLTKSGAIYEDQADYALR